jgi:hypothetical protein
MPGPLHHILFLACFFRCSIARVLGDAKFPDFLPRLLVIAGLCPSSASFSLSLFHYFWEPKCLVHMVETPCDPLKYFQRQKYDTL